MGVAEYTLKYLDELVAKYEKAGAEAAIKD